MISDELTTAYPEFALIDSPDWQTVMGRAQRMDLPLNTVMLTEGDTCEQFALLVKGSVRVYQPAPDGREITLYRLAAGDICMMSLNSLLHKRPFMAVAAAESDITIHALCEEDFQSAMQVSDAFRALVLSKITDRFLDMIQLLQDTVFRNLDMRLACLLGHLFERNQGPTLHITHETIANELGTSREVISRLLKEFERKGCIKLLRGKIELSSPEGLRWFDRA